jgi:hypothetical protein
MKTTLEFEGPSDLSIGRVRIDDPEETVVEWIATPDQRSFVREDVRPGTYSVEITPSGGTPQAVVFEVKEGEANKVHLPEISALSSTGSNTNFYDTATHRTSARVPMSASAMLEMPALPTVDLPVTQPRRPEVFPAVAKRISVALSQGGAERPDSYGPFMGKAGLELGREGLTIEVQQPLAARLEASTRVRLSVSIEGSRIERCLVPMYAGGARIYISPSPITPADVTIQVLPNDPRLRAMVRALGAGAIEEAVALKAGVQMPAQILDEHASVDVSPWEMIIYGLLTLRFPEVFTELEDAWVQVLSTTCGWAYDTHVIRAHQVVASAGDDSAAQVNAAACAVGYLLKAQVSGSPYFAYTNQLFTEMIGWLCELDMSNQHPLAPRTSALIKQVAARCKRESPLQRTAGVAFSWLRRDLKALRDFGLLLPNRRSTGVLHSRGTTVVFRGTLKTDSITVGRAGDKSPDKDVGLDQRSPIAEKGLLGCPALGREKGPLDDPNKGRFGGAAVDAGLRFDASFKPAKRRGWVIITCCVTAQPDVPMEVGALAVFFLHPTFSPSQVNVRFTGQRATLSVEAWGAFTVGVWIPSARVELECDLAELPSVPSHIKAR